MSRYLNYGQTSVRPGNYFNYDKKGAEPVVGSVDGITAILFRADWGPLNKPITRSQDEGYEDIFGNGGTTDTIALSFEGGTMDAILVRVGTGGTAATTNLKMEGDNAADNTVKLTAKYVGSKALTVSVRDSIIDDTKREMIVYDGTTEFEKVEFDKGDNEASGLVAAMASSDKFSAQLTGGDGSLTTVTQQAFTAGTDPTVSATEYEAGFKALETEVMNCITVDTDDWKVIALLSAFVTRMFNAGTNMIGIVGEPATVDLETRLSHAASLNSAQMVYVLNGKCDHAIYGTIDGYQTAAKIGGMVSGTSCMYSLTHSVVQNVTDLSENLSNSEIINGETHGCLVLTKNKSGQIWIDAAINTLVTLNKNQDSGWKKIRRTKTRLEVLTRCNDTVDSMVGQVNNDNAGRKAILDAIGGVLEQMIGENKITWYNVEEDPTHVAQGDSCWFIIDIIDKDSAEHIYLRYLFRYNTNLAAEVTEQGASTV